MKTLYRSAGCNKLKKLLLRYRNLDNREPSITMKDIEEIGVLNKKTLAKDPSFKDATILVATRRERAELSRKIGQTFAKNKGVTFYWWYKRPSKGNMSTEEADALSQGMKKYIPNVEGYYIQGAPCMMKQNIAPMLGYANGSQGRMIGIVPKEGDQIPPGAPGEMIMIEPPEYIIMEVHHSKAGREWTTVVPCKLQEDKLDYKRDGHEKVYYCRSNKVNLKFAMTIHETQGLTLKRVLLLLGRLTGLRVGGVTWSLLYVALSRARFLKDIKFFPCGLPGFQNFRYLTKLKPSSKFLNWTKTYRNRLWCPHILEKQQEVNEKNVLNKLLKQGPKDSLGKTNNVLRGYLTGLGDGKLSALNRHELQTRVIMHMERKKLWKLGEDKAKFLSSRGSNKRQRSKVSKKKSSRKITKVLKKNQSNPLSEKTASKKSKRKLSKKKHPGNKKKCKKKHEDETLPDRYLLPDELQFEKFLFESKGYRINPIKRDGNCLFGAVADQVHLDPSLHKNVRSSCVKYMTQNGELYSQFIDDDHLNFTQYINRLKLDGSWGGNPEITALSQVFACPIEVYRDSEIPTVFASENFNGDTNHIIRLYYANNHYSSVRPDDQGGQVFNFQALQSGDLENQVALLEEAHKPQKDIISDNSLSDLEKAEKQSKVIADAFDNYLRFYAERLFKSNCSPQQ